MSPWSTGCRIGVLLAGMKTTLIPLYIPIRFLEWPEALPMNSSILKAIFFWAVGLKSGLKIFSKPCFKEICCLPGFVALFRDHKPSKFSIILKGSRNLGNINMHWLQLNSPAALALTRVRKSFVPLNQDTDLSSLVMKVLNGIYFQYKVLKICCVGQIPSLVILARPPR